MTEAKKSKREIIINVTEDFLEKGVQRKPGPGG